MTQNAGVSSLNWRGGGYLLPPLLGVGCKNITASSLFS